MDARIKYRDYRGRKSRGNLRILQDTPSPGHPDGLIVPLQRIELILGNTRTRRLIRLILHHGGIAAPGEDEQKQAARCSEQADATQDTGRMTVSMGRESHGEDNSTQRGLSTGSTVNGYLKRKSLDAGEWPADFFELDLSDEDLRLLRTAGRELEETVMQNRRNRGAPIL